MSATTPTREELREAFQRGFEAGDSFYDGFHAHQLALG
jgi:hypothetical protein